MHMASMHMHGHIGAWVYGVEFVWDINTKGAICQDDKDSSLFITREHHTSMANTIHTYNLQIHIPS